MRLLALLSLLFVTPVYAEPIPYGGETVTMRALPQPSDGREVNPNVRYAGGFEVVAHGTSQVAGLSDLEVRPDGQVIALSDLGTIVRFSLGGGPVKIDLLRDEDGRTAINRDVNDTEDMASGPDGARYLSYERFHRIMAFAPGVPWDGKPARLGTSGLPAMPFNEGLEGLAYVGGHLLAGAESGGFWLCGTQTPGCRGIDGPPVPGFLYKLVSLAPVPDHDAEVLALYRYYDPFGGPRSILRLLRLFRDSNGNDSLVKVEDLLRVPPSLADNYEGVAAVKTPSGYRLYLISDSLQDDGRPRLLMFDWAR